MIELGARSSELGVIIFRLQLVIIIFGLYIHVPLCLKKCAYCDFYSQTRLDEEGYKNAVLRNIARYNEKNVIYDSIYFGGGTPSLMPTLTESVIKAAPHTLDAEITVECNPETVDRSRLVYLQKAGVNRVSFGVQSLDDSELSALGRIHTAEKAVEAISAAGARFSNISADIMLGIPRQTRASLKRTIDGLAALPVTHISAYILKIEENTPFGKNTPELPDEDETAKLYLEAVRLLTERGFSQYEISNFAKEGYECRHNLKYWRAEEYIGIGPAAHSYYNRKRFAVPRDVKGFIENELQTEEIIEEFPDESEEKIMLGLRLREGIPLTEKIKKRLSLIPPEYYRVENNTLSLTAKGFLVSNEIIATILNM